MKFDREFLLEEILYGDNYIENKLISAGRWTLYHELIFEFESKYYKIGYRTGATEYQEEQPWEYEGERIECIEVEPVVESITVYKEIEQ